MAKKTFTLMKMLLAKTVYFAMMTGSCNPGQGYSCLWEIENNGQDQAWGVDWWITVFSGATGEGNSRDRAIRLGQRALTFLLTAISCYSQMFPMLVMYIVFTHMQSSSPHSQQMPSMAFQSGGDRISL